MLMLHEVRAIGSISFDLSGDPHDMRRLAAQLVTVGNAQLAARVQDAARTSELVAGRAIANVSLVAGEFGAPHSVVEAAQGAGVALDRSTEEVEPDASLTPEA